EGPAATGLAFSSDRHTLTAVLTSGAVRLWEVPSGRPGKTYSWVKKLDLSRVRHLLFSPDGRSLLLVDYSDAASLYALPGGELRWRGTARCAAFAPDGAAAVFAPEDRHLTLLDPATGKERARVALEWPPNAPYARAISRMAFAPDGRRLAVASSDG